METTGNLPISSGIIPNSTRSSWTTFLKTWLVSNLPVLSFSEFELKPKSPTLVLFEIISSNPENEPPQINKILVVSMDT